MFVLEFVLNLDQDMFLGNYNNFENITELNMKGCSNSPFLLIYIYMCDICRYVEMILIRMCVMIMLVLMLILINAWILFICGYV